MQPFRYRLQTLLDAAEHRENAVRSELARVRDDERRLRRALDEVCLRMHREQEDRHGALRGRIDVEDLRRRQGYLETLHRCRHRQQELVDAAAEKSHLVQERLIAAARWRRSLELMRERLRDDYVVEYKRAEVNEHDDMTTVRLVACRNQGGLS